LTPDLEPQVDRINTIAAKARGAFESNFRAQVVSGRRVLVPPLVTPAPPVIPAPDRPLPIGTAGSSPKGRDRPTVGVAVGGGDLGSAQASGMSRFLNFLKTRFLFWR
jgi:hypothetical protein